MFVTLPDSFHVRSAPDSQAHGLAALPRFLPVPTERSNEPGDPAAAWFDFATVAGVVETVANLLQG